MGGDPNRVAGGAQCVRMGLLALLGTFEMITDVRIGEARRDGGVGRAGVQLAASMGRQLGVEGVADQGVPEVVRDLVAERPDEEALGQLAQPGVHDLRAIAADRGQEIHIERAAENRRGGGERSGRWGELIGTDQHGVGQRGWQVADRGEELLDVQRNPVASFVHVPDEVGRQRRAPDGRQHDGRVGLAESGEPGFLGEPLGEQSRAPAPHRNPRIELVAAIRPDQQQR